MGCSTIITKALIPVGGLGTRLYPLTVETSKAMIRFANKFLIDFIIHLLALEGVEEFYLGVSGYTNYKTLHDHLGSYFKVHLGRSKFKIVRIRYQPNVETVGNAHSVRALLEYYEIKDPVVIVQCDTIASFDVKDMSEYHEEKKAFMTIALKDIHDPQELRHFGVAVLTPDGLIRGFIEKPKDLSLAPSNLVNTGIYILSREMINYLLSDEFNEMIKRGLGDFGMHVIPRLIERGEIVAGYKLRGFWFDVGTPERLLQASLYAVRNFDGVLLDVETEYKGLRLQGRSKQSKMRHIEIIERIVRGDVSVSGDILLGRHTSIGARVRLEDSVIDNYVIVGDDSSIKRSIIMDRCIIKGRTVIEDSIIGRHVTIGLGVKIHNSVVGDNVVIEDEVVLSNCKVWPHRVVRRGVVCRDSTII